MGAALEMPRKRSRLFQVLGLSQFFSDTPDAQHPQISKVKGSTSLPGTSGTIQSCHLQLHKPAFLSLRKGLMRNFSLGLQPRVDSHAQIYTQEAVRALKHSH